jgi:uncharacterized protein YndB with AHSA1/START domain
VVVSKLAVCPLAEAFAAWTQRIDDWWPRARTLGGDAVERVVLEAGVEGRFFERWHDGSEHVRATVTAWEPPDRLELAWIDGDAAGTDVTVLFAAAGPASTRVTIEHRGFERLAGGAEVRARYSEGPGSAWNGPLSAFGDAVVDPAVHRYFGVRLNNASWDLFDAAEAEELLHSVHTSAWHWRQIGAPENLARGDWMCSHAYAVLGHGALAALFAQRTLRICGDNGIGDFDLAYAYEAGARAAAASGDLGEARRLRQLARQAGDAIADADDKAIFAGDLAAPPWYGADVD